MSTPTRTTLDVHGIATTTAAMTTPVTIVVAPGGARRMRSLFALAEVGQWGGRFQRTSQGGWLLRGRLAGVSGCQDGRCSGAAVAPRSGSRHVRDEVRVESDVAERHLTIVECRPPWLADFGSEWTRFPIARLRYTKATRLWSMYWRDRNLKFHEYDRLPASASVEELLAEVDPIRP